jgi:hypothetical protein
MRSSQPHHILMVRDAMTGQDAVKQAQALTPYQSTGIIMTKLDGDARGSAALHARYTVANPFFCRNWGKLDAREPFYPDRLASRILGMGDVVSLIEKAQQAYQEKESLRLEKLTGKEFSLADFQEHLRTITKMGSIGEILEMPGRKKLAKGRSHQSRSGQAGRRHDQFHDPEQTPARDSQWQSAAQDAAAVYHCHGGESSHQAIPGNEENDAASQSLGRPPPVRSDAGFISVKGRKL